MVSARLWCTSLGLDKLHLMHSSCYCHKKLEMSAPALHFAVRIRSFIVQLKAVVFEAGCVFAASVGQDCPSGQVQRMKREECNVLIFQNLFMISFSILQ